MTYHLHPLLIFRVNITLCNQLCLVLEGNRILFCVPQVRCFFNFSRADFTYQSTEQLCCYVGCFIWRSKNSDVVFFSRNKSSILIKSILNLCDFLKYYLHCIFKVEIITCSNKSFILPCVPAKDVYVFARMRILGRFVSQ